MAYRHSGILVIGIGNPDRGDDAAGRAVAARLKAQAPADMQVIESDGEATGLLARFSEADDVILVDAALSDGAPGTIECFDVHETPLPVARFSMSSHGFGLGEAIALARALDQLPRRCTVYAIAGRSFAPGDTLSPDVENGVDEVVARILETVSEKAG